MKNNITVKRINRIESNKSNVAMWRENAQRAWDEIHENKHDVIHVTIPSNDDKLAGFNGINTSVANNPICASRRAHALAIGDYNNICIWCYADKLLNFRKSLDIACMYNQHILTSHLLTDTEIDDIPLTALNVRFEMFGETSSITHAENYDLIAIRRNEHFFGWWSKNWKWVLNSFREYGKPNNLTYVLSSRHMNQVDEIPREIEPYTDYVFTVCDNEEIYRDLIKKYNGVACAGVSCMQCKHCYRRGNARYVFELLRK